MQIIRTKRHGVFAVASNALGCFLQQADDPDAQVDTLKPEDLKEFRLHPDYQKIPQDLWQRWYFLAKHVCEHFRNVEIGVRLLRSEEDPAQWRIICPPQHVSSATVEIETHNGAVDITTGEVIESYPPAGWREMGTSH